MKFSLKTIATAVLVAALISGLVTTSYLAASLERRLTELQDSHGLVTLPSDGDRWETVAIGQWTSDQDDVFLLRVRNFVKYKLNIHFFDGLTSEYKTASHLLVANETAVRLIADLNTIYVHDTTFPIDNETNLDIIASPNIYSITYGRATNVVSAAPIRAFGILTSESNQPSFGTRNNDLFMDRDIIEKTCKEHKMKCAWFTIVER